MEPLDLDDAAAFSADRYQKVPIVESDRLFVDVYCLEPGQAQDPHEHHGADKVYLVLEGSATATLGGSDHHLEAGQLIHAPAGVSHGIRNDGDRRLRALVWMAPPPGDHGGHHHGHVEATPRRVAVITVSSTRSTADDDGGARLQERLVAAGQEVASYEVVDDDIESIRQALEGAIPAADAVVITGGTGVTPDDVTIEAIGPLLQKVLPGFGEHFRRLSVDQIGSAVIMTRATAGIVEKTPVFAIPGSPSAVDLAVTQIILPELDHVVDLARR